MESDSLHEHDKSWKAFFITTLFILCTANVYAQSSDTIFSRYFRYAQNFADAYPREKVSLHLDNASYYLGDTIWFKAYVVTAEQNLPTTISKPLYVELLDQLGNVVERQSLIRDEINQNKTWNKIGNGRKPKKDIVQKWRLEHPEGKKADCIRDTGLTKPTVYKWWNIKK